MIKFRRLRCSFCRKNESQVLKLVAGPRAYICDQCVEAAARIMRDDSGADGPPSEARPAIWRRALSRARRALGWHGRAQRLNSPGVSV